MIVDGYQAIIQTMTKNRKKHIKIDRFESKFIIDSIYQVRFLKALRLPRTFSRHNFCALWLKFEHSGRISRGPKKLWSSGFTTRSKLMRSTFKTSYNKTARGVKVGQRLRGISTAIKYSFIPILPENLFLQLDRH